MAESKIGGRKSSVKHKRSAERGRMRREFCRDNGGKKWEKRGTWSQQVQLNIG